VFDQEQLPLGDAECAASAEDSSAIGHRLP
jgi:hypothetical protein